MLRIAAGLPTAGVVATYRANEMDMRPTYANPVVLHDDAVLLLGDIRMQPEALDLALGALRP